MKDIIVPEWAKAIAPLVGSIDTALLLWLSTRTKDGILEIGSGDGARTRLYHLFNKSYNRQITGCEWSQEHRIDKKQKRPVWAKDLILSNQEEEYVKALDQDPATLLFTELHPLGFVSVDYDYSFDGLDRICTPLIHCLGSVGESNAVMAWVGYTEERYQRHPMDKKQHLWNQVWRYVNSMNLPNCYHFIDSTVCFHIFRPDWLWLKSMGGLQPR